MTTSHRIEFAALVALLAALVAWALVADRPPSPRDGHTPAGDFAEERARRTVEALIRVQDVSPRETGTAGARAAEHTLRDELAALVATGRAELEVHEARGDATDPLFRENVVAWHVRDVLLRVHGRDDTRAVAVSAHYDSPPGSPGAADDAAGVATAIETARALVASAPLAHAVVFDLDEGEETDLAGARAFLSHPWARTTRAVVNVDAGGTAGKLVVLQAGPGNPWLLDAYARAVPRPYATALAQDLFDTGAVLGVVTDFRVYRTVGWTGFDLTLFEDGFAYHTRLDRPARREPGTLQHMGDTTLALVRALADGPLPGDIAPDARPVFFDVAGRVLVHYERTTSSALGLAALVLAVFAAWRMARREGFSAREIARSLGIALGATLSGTLVPAALALIAPLVLRRPHGWFAHPWLAVLAYGATGLAVAASVHARANRTATRAGEQATQLATVGGTLAWAIALAAMVLAHRGGAYVPLVWTAPFAIALLVPVRSARARWAILLGALVPGVLLTAQASTMALTLAPAMAGRLPMPIPFDPILAVLAAGAVVALTLLPLTMCARLGRDLLRISSRIAFACGAVGFVALVFVAPYSATRPKRLLVEHEDDGVPGHARIVYRAQDYPSLDTVFARTPAPRAIADSASRAFPFPLVSRALAADPSHEPAVQFAVLAREADAAHGLRRVTVRLTPGPHDTRSQIAIPRAALVSWSLATPPPQLSPDNGYYVVDVVGADARGWDMTLVLRGDAPVTVRLARFTTQASAPLARAIAALPAWTTSTYWVARVSEETL